MARTSDRNFSNDATVAVLCLRVRHQPLMLGYQLPNKIPAVKQLKKSNKLRWKKDVKDLELNNDLRGTRISSQDYKPIKTLLELTKAKDPATR